MLLLSKEINNQDSRIFVIAGPCVIESEKLIFEMADFLKRLSEKLGVFLILRVHSTKLTGRPSTALEGQVT